MQETFQPLNNYVVIEPDRRYSDMVIGQLRLDMDTTYEPNKHSLIRGQVVALPDSLIYDKESYLSMPWKTENELQVGDTVYYHYLSFTNAVDKNDPRRVFRGSRMYIFVKYDRIYAAIRENRVMPINGHALIEPIGRQKKLGLSIPSRFKQHSTEIGKVKYLAKPNKGYKLDKEDIPDDENVKEGDIVVMDKVCDIPLEYPMHASIDGGDKLFRVERRLLMATE